MGTASQEQQDEWASFQGESGMRGSFQGPSAINFGLAKKFRKKYAIGLGNGKVSHADGDDELGEMHMSLDDDEAGPWPSSLQRGLPRVSEMLKDRKPRKSETITAQQLKEEAKLHYAAKNMEDYFADDLEGEHAY